MSVGTIISNMSLGIPWGKNIINFSDQILAPSFDYDFTNLLPEKGENYMRGSRKYLRPYGWKKYALNVNSQNAWLGPNGIRQTTAPGEWIVVYHGTSSENASRILNDGRFNPSIGGQHGPGIYSTNCPVEAEKYSLQKSGNQQYLYIFQCRLNLESPSVKEYYKHIDNNKNHVYYYVCNYEDIHAYGLLEKKREKGRHTQ